MSKTPQRKIIQIAVATDGKSGDLRPRLFALCDDGSVWIFHNHEWRRIVATPDDEADR